MQSKKQSARYARHRKVRTRVQGTSLRPRMVVFRSLRHLEAQLIDDTKGVTMLSGSTSVVKDAKGTKTEKAVQLGKSVGEKARSAGITTVVFDRGGYAYHGRVKAFAEAARKAGLKF